MHFNSTKVQFGVEMLHTIQSPIHHFNSTKVQFGVAQMHGLMSLLTNFNSTKVQFGGDHVGERLKSMTVFQFH